MHQNRHNTGTFWPIPRKGKKYVALSTHDKRESMPLVVVMRDVLGIVQTEKELKKAIHEKQISVNGKIVQEAHYPLSLFDVFSIKSMGKKLKVFLSDNRRFMFKEVSGKESESKVYKVIGKKVLSKGKIQVNLAYGKNVLIKDNVMVGDSIVIGFDGKIIKIIKMEKGSKGYVVKGKHMGHVGKMTDIIMQGGKKLAQIADGKEEVTVWIKNVVAIE